MHLTLFPVTKDVGALQQCRYHLHQAAVEGKALADVVVEVQFWIAKLLPLLCTSLSVLFQISLLPWYQHMLGLPIASISLNQGKTSSTSLVLDVFFDEFLWRTEVAMCTISQRACILQRAMHYSTKNTQYCACANLHCKLGILQIINHLFNLFGFGH